MNLDELLMERYHLAKDRISEICTEKMAQPDFEDFFKKTAAFLTKTAAILEREKEELTEEAVSEEFEKAEETAEETETEAEETADGDAEE